MRDWLSKVRGEDLSPLFEGRGDQKIVDTVSWRRRRPVPVSSRYGKTAGEALSLPRRTQSERFAHPCRVFRSHLFSGGDPRYRQAASLLRTAGRADRKFHRSVVYVAQIAPALRHDRQACLTLILACRPRPLNNAGVH